MKDILFIIKCILIALSIGVIGSLLFHEITIRFMDYMHLGNGHETISGSLIYKRNW